MSETQATIFADDTTNYTARQALQQVQQALQVDLGNIREWVCRNKLVLKTKVVGLFHQEMANIAWDTIKYVGSTNWVSGRNQTTKGAAGQLRLMVISNNSSM